jgi:hypothetical protein
LLILLRERRVFQIAWITVEWSLPPNLCPIREVESVVTARASATGISSERGSL